MPSSPLGALRFFLASLALAALAVGASRPAPGSAAQPVALANVRGIVWYDDAGTGQRAGSEPLAPGAQVLVYPDSGLPTIYANSEGAFAFSVPEGTYTVEVWWDGPGITARAPDGRSGAYHVATVRLAAGVNQELSLGVRPTGRFPALVDAKIEAVWPHDRAGQPRQVSGAPLANVVAYLFHAGTDYPVPCGYSPRVNLVAAVDDRPGRVVAEGIKRVVYAQGKWFPTWEFNDVDVSAAQDPANRVYFWLQAADGASPDEYSYAQPRFRSSVWAHGLDGRTYSPRRTQPAQTSLPDRVAARVDVAWPHDGRGRERPVDQARFANVDVLLMDAQEPGTSVSPSYDAEVWLLKSLNGGPAEVVRGRRVLVSQQDPAYPKWIFEDVDVGESRDPASPGASSPLAPRYYFRVAVAGQPVTTNVWAHGLDGRTYFPARDVPAASGFDCP